MRPAELYDERKGRTFQGVFTYEHDRKYIDDPNNTLILVANYLVHATGNMRIRLIIRETIIGDLKS